MGATRKNITKSLVVLALLILSSMRHPPPGASSIPSLPCSLFCPFICLSEGKLIGPAILLALAISFKPTALPLIPVTFVYLLADLSGTYCSICRIYDVVLPALAWCRFQFWVGSHPDPPALECPFQPWGRSVIHDLPGELIKGYYQLPGNGGGWDCCGCLPWALLHLP